MAAEGAQRQSLPQFLQGLFPILGSGRLAERTETPLAAGLGQKSLELFHFDQSPAGLPDCVMR